MPASSTSALELTFSSGADVLARLALDAGEYLIGSAESCEIVIDLPGVAERHARLHLNGSGGWVEAVAGHETRLDGALLKERTPFLAGQRIDFGPSATLQIESPTQGKKPAKARAAGKAARPAKAAKTSRRKAAAPEPPPPPPAQNGEICALREELEALREKHRRDVEALMAARVSAESDLKIIREALIVKQAAAARHLREMEDAHALRVKALEEELRSAPATPVPVLAPVPTPIIRVEATVVKPEPAPISFPEYRPDRPVPSGRSLRRDDDFANVIGLLHARESQLMETKAALRRVEDRCAELAEHVTNAQGATSKVERWRKLAGAASIVIVAALVGIASLGSMLSEETERAERAELVVQRVKNSAPRFATDAVDLLEQGEFEPALVKAVAAVTLDPQSSQLRLLQGNILQSMLQLDAAAASYRESLALDPKQGLAAENLLLCQRILSTRKGVHSPESLYALHRAMMQQKRLAEALRMAERFPRDRQLLRQTWVAVMEANGLPARIEMREDGNFDVDLSGLDRVDLSVLRGMPVSGLTLTRSNLSDISELKGFPLRNLDLSNTQVRDLSPLQGMSLERLNVANTDVTNVFALRGMPLRELILDHAPINSIAELHGLPLETLRLAGTKVWSTQPLAGLPLKILDLSRTRVAEIAALEHLPIQWLDLAGTSVSDLRPLAGSSVRTLNLARTLVSDVSPLAGRPLRELNLGECRQLTSVRPLATCLELERLVVPQESKDIAALRTLPRLRFLSFGQGQADPARDITAREFWLSYREQ